LSVIRNGASLSFSKIVFSIPTSFDTTRNVWLSSSPSFLSQDLSVSSCCFSDDESSERDISFSLIGVTSGSFSLTQSNISFFSTGFIWIIILLSFSLFIWMSDCEWSGCVECECERKRLIWIIEECFVRREKRGEWEWILCCSEWV
jgi:hypothetical protein